MQSPRLRPSSRLCILKIPGQCEGTLTFEKPSRELSRCPRMKSPIFLFLEQAQTSVRSRTNNRGTV